MINVGINGAGGRMGATLIRLITEAKDFKLTAAIDRPNHPQIGKDAGILAGLSKPIGVKLAASIDKKPDVMIDFSLPVGTMACLDLCKKYKIPLVIGTTGFDKTQLSKIKAASKMIPCLLSPNMSLGANLLFRLGGAAAQTLGPDYDMEIVETHHRFKKDAPSGTAKRLAETVSRASKKNIPIHSLRIGDVVGDHTVVFSNLGERIELTHRVNNRDIFARGAIYAAKLLARAKPGLYSMADILT